MIELLLTLTIVAMIMTYGYSSFSDSRVAIEAETDRQYILKIPVLLEQFYADKLTYPSHLGEILSSNNSRFFTPKSYYFLSYRRDTGNNYLVTATLNSKKQNADKVDCAVISVNATGYLKGYDKAGNAASDLCWK